MGKVVIDVNIWISYLLNKRLKTLVRYVRNKRIIVVTCKEQLQEFDRVFEKPYLMERIPAVQMATFRSLLNSFTELIATTSQVDICRDPKDNYLLALAQDANADYLITGDKDLLVLQRFGTTNIIRYADFELLMENLVKD